MHIYSMSTDEIIWILYSSLDRAFIVKIISELYKMAK